ncbi:GTP cyclohydrolase [Dendrosporobacter sp. 1207_IL3150]|uniref:GTP cyclohydrolase n=1 Tax=Dendrosporobacter sp. 1207_IL3150 TaxID=3084054 RepID=UPI002FDA598F
MAKINIAVVGPSDSVALICDVAQEKADKINILPFIYQDAPEVPDIIAQNDDRVDAWLFSGKVPHMYALKSNKTSKPLLYIPHTGSSLYRVLIQILYIERLEIDRISFDTFSAKEIEETFTDISLDMPEYYTNEYSGTISGEELTKYHYDLWQDSKTSIAVTCFHSSFRKLKQLGIPAFRIWPTRSNIRSMLSTAINKVEAARFKGGQIAIHHIVIGGYDDFVREAASGYDAKRKELQLYDILIKYTEAVKGSILMHDNGRYTIYSTRGSVEEVTKSFTTIPVHEDITQKLAINVSGGIGFGQTAHAADQNAHAALGLARQAGDGKWMVVLDNKVALGPLNSAVHIKYEIRCENKDVRKLAEQLNVSITTINKLIAVFTKLENKVVNADDIALYLNITTRSARRLLGNLVDNDFAELVGEEGVGKGRPRKLYQVLLNKLVALVK